MNWRLVALLSCAGIVIGTVVIVGAQPATVGWLWIAVAVITTVVIAIREPNRGFRHGFAVGFLGGIFTPLMQAIFFRQYLANYPPVANQLQDLPLGLGPAAYLLLLAPVAGLVNGLTLGVMGWVAGRLRPRPKTEPAAA